MAAPVFYYDVTSPFAYLAAERVDEVLPGIEWQPIAFGPLLRDIGRVPWSMNDDMRPDGMQEVERRAAERGLPPVQWPDGWPYTTYSVAPLRAILFADELGHLKELTLAYYRKHFVDGIALNDPDVVLDVAASCGFGRDQVSVALERDDIKQRLRDATDAAAERGVTGVPTVAVGDELFWGDDHLELAAAAATA